MRYTIVYHIPGEKWHIYKGIWYDLDDAIKVSSKLFATNLPTCAMFAVRIIRWVEKGSPEIEQEIDQWR